MSERTRPGAWPPEPTAEAPWRKERLRSLEHSGLPVRVTVRSVPLWGRQVLIDEDNRVYCSDCWSFIDVAELGSPANTHDRVGLSGRWSGQFLPMAADDDPRVEEQW